MAVIAEIDQVGAGLGGEFDQPEIDEGAAVEVGSVATEDEGLELGRDDGLKRADEGGGLVAVDDELDGVGIGNVAEAKAADGLAAGGRILAIDDGRLTEADEDFAVEIGAEDGAGAVVVVEEGLGRVDDAIIGVDGEGLGEFKEGGTVEGVVVFDDDAVAVVGDFVGPVDFFELADGEFTVTHKNTPFKES